MASVISNPNYGLQYDSNMLNQLDNIATLQVAAYQDSNGTPMNLTLGASSNVNVEAVRGVNMIFSSNAAFKLYNYDLTGGVRSNIEILKIAKESNYTLIETSNALLKVSGGDTTATTTVSTTTIKTSNTDQVLSTSSCNFVFEKPVIFASNMSIKGNSFTSTFNVHKIVTPSEANSNLSQVAYSFFINEYNQLQLVQQNVYSNSNVEIKGLNVFGTMSTSSNKYIGEASNYSVVKNYKFSKKNNS